MSDDFVKRARAWLEKSAEPFTKTAFAPSEGPTSYWVAEEVERTASLLIPKYHKTLGNANVRIAYFFRSDVPKRGGKFVFGSTKKIMGLNAALAESDEPFFCIVIAHPVWEVLPFKHRDALVDHELCHCGVEIDEQGNVNLTLRNHDVQEFSDIVHRYGAWSPDVQEFLNAALSAKKEPPPPMIDRMSLAAGEKPD